MSLERTVKWIDKTGNCFLILQEGRDKFCKAIQYACRFLKFYFNKSGDKATQIKFDTLFVAMRDARKLFRLFKAINQYKKIQEIFQKGSDLDLPNLLAILTRAFFGIYWIYDNLNILSKLKIIEKDPIPFGKAGSFFWLLALLTNLIAIVREFILNEKKIEHLKRSSLNDQRAPKEHKKNSSLEEKKRIILSLNLLKVLGDILPAGEGSQIFKKLFGWSVNDMLCGLGGFISAVITSYQLYE